MSFPEEPLHLPPHKGGGYYPAMIHQKLNGDKYEIIRKLGYGPQSSTWLAFDSKNTTYHSIEIFTIGASEQAKSKQVPILKGLGGGRPLPVFLGTFWEKGDDKSHLCVLTNPLSTSVRVLQQEAEHQRLPAHAVQMIVHTAAEALERLHRQEIMHGAVKAENIFFSVGDNQIESILASEPALTATGNKKYVTVRSQPLPHSFKWKDKMKKVVDWPLYLGNLSHAQRSCNKPEENNNYLSAPETLLGNASCSIQTDIWMLGIMAFHLLTKKTLFHPKGNVSTQIATMCAVLEDEVPKEWLSDSKMKGYNAAASDEPVTSIEASLLKVLHKDDAAEAATFIKSCLRLDPEKRLTATECRKHGWLSDATACSCCFP